MEDAYGLNGIILLLARLATIVDVALFGLFSLVESGRSETLVASESFGCKNVGRKFGLGRLVVVA